MSNYYEYRDVKVMIAHKLMSMDGWKVYGYKEDRSDSMTDYYDPANWDGVAEKNGYILCVDVYGAAEPKEIRKYNYDGFTYDNSIQDKITKLEQMTVERGASEAEEASAKIMIERLQKKAEEEKENRNKYIVIGHVPGHMAHPPRMNWHIEKDGMIIAKGNGILKYAHIDSYYKYDGYIEDYEYFKEIGADAWEKEKAEYIFKHDAWCDTMEEAERSAKHKREEMEKDSKLINQFESFINKIDTTCGGLLGEGDGTIYEKVVVTEYKTELKPVETATGEIKEGQLFILKSNFNYGRRKGFVYRIHETEYDGKVSYHAYKLNGKLTKECTGQANTANYWYVGSGEYDALTKWIEKGAIAWCELQEVKTPYEVEKVVKKKVKAATAKTSKKEKVNTEEKKASSDDDRQTSDIDVNAYTYEVLEDVDTRTNEKIYLVKVIEKLSREEYLQVNKYIKSLGGYYSRFKHAFLFKEDPTDKLKGSAMETKASESEMETSCQEEQQPENNPMDTNGPGKESISYIITEDVHTKTGSKIWVVKPDKELNREVFSEVKRKLATLQGFYSGFKHGFIFKYNPEEVLQTG